MNYELKIYDDEGGLIFQTSKPTLEMLEEEIGRFKRHVEEGYRAVEPGVYLK